jgi:ribosomal protein S12 methylthiotransferase accessory factor YcaO
MKRLTLALAFAALASGCGVAPNAHVAAPAGITAAATNTWLGLKEMTVRQGGPGDFFPKCRRHLDAKTPKNGRIWVLDDPKGVMVLHNTQEVTNAKKLAQIADAIDAAAEQAEPELAKQAREFSALIRASLKK